EFHQYRGKFVVNPAIFYSGNLGHGIRPCPLFPASFGLDSCFDCSGTDSDESEYGYQQFHVLG
ncbi:MAG: hypothetical protein GWO24_28290, partial [Akkermansiaceae bacterium]|nr:hypothetical protein [Akkermansiaceae bacterium]